MCMQQILEKGMNPNCAFYHEQAKERYTQYTANVCTVLAPGMDYIWRHGESDIQVTSPVWNKSNKEV